MIDQHFSFYIHHPGEVVAIVLFVLLALSNVILITGMRTFISLGESREHLAGVVAELQHRTRNQLASWVQ